MVRKPVLWFAIVGLAIGCAAAKWHHQLDRDLFAQIVEGDNYAMQALANKIVIRDEIIQSCSRNIVELLKEWEALKKVAHDQRNVIKKQAAALEDAHKKQADAQYWATQFAKELKKTQAINRQLRTHRGCL